MEKEFTYDPAEAKASAQIVSFLINSQSFGEENQSSFAEIQPWFLPDEL